MMGVSGFFITFAFPRKEQNFTKQAFMLPWLSIGNFTNLPTYDFGQLLVGSFTLLFGISIVSLVHYALFMPCLLYTSAPAIVPNIRSTPFCRVWPMLGRLITNTVNPAQNGLSRFQ